MTDEERLAASFALLTDTPGSTYELGQRQLGDRLLPYFVNAPTNLGELFRESLQHAEADFYVFGAERFNFAATYAQAARVANALQKSGIGQGDRVGICMRNYPEWIFAYMGITATGAVAVALNSWWTGTELSFGIADSGLQLLIADGERLQRLQQLSEPPQITYIAVRGGIAELPNNTQSWSDWLQGAATDMPVVEVSGTANATILYTSGSTAHPKGVLASQFSIIQTLLGWEFQQAVAMHALPEMFDLDPAVQSSTILTVPLFHVTGLNVQLLSSYRSGRKLVGMYKWDATSALKIIADEQITSFNGVPTMAWELVQHPDFEDYDTSSLRSAGGGGAAMAPEQSKQLQAKFASAAPGTGYGLTETNGLGTTISGAALLDRPRSCGRAVSPIVSIKIIDAAGVEQKAGDTGEIWIFGAQNFSGYWNNETATTETLSDGWVHTGDIGHLDTEGYLYITDRAKDMVIRGGENIGCQEVEAVLYEHPAVLECAVYGVPDRRLGETLAASVALKSGHLAEADELRAHVATQLAHYKVPQYFFIATTPLPRIASGKIYKRGLREQAIQTLAIKP